MISKCPSQGCDTIGDVCCNACEPQIEELFKKDMILFGTEMPQSEENSLTLALVFIIFDERADLCRVRHIKIQLCQHRFAIGIAGYSDGFAEIHQPAGQAYDCKSGKYDDEFGGLNRHAECLEDFGKKQFIRKFRIFIAADHLVSFQ